MNFILVAGAQSDNGLIQMVLMGAIMLVFWLFMIRPQSQKAKEQKKFVDDLQKGSKIVTHSGIHGSIYKVNEDGTLMIEISTGTYVKMDKSAISMDMTLTAYKPAATK